MAMTSSLQWEPLGEEGELEFLSPARLRFIPVAFYSLLQTLPNSHPDS